MNGVLERVIENWLTSINERSLEIPFCQLMAGEGYQVVHLSRHGPFEEGKDILAIDPDGVPCAFQLKGSENGKITQNQWSKFYAQIVRLVEVPIIHPSIDSTAPRRVYFVTNGELDEEVRVEIDRLNISWEQRNCPRLEVIVKGQLLERFKRLHLGWFPSGLSFEKSLLELFLEDGYAYLPKARLAKFLSSLLPISVESASALESRRSLASAAVITTYALFPYYQKFNHVAIIEGWVIYIASLASLVDKHSLDASVYDDSLRVAVDAVEMTYKDLIDELSERPQLVEGDPLVDAPFYRGRITWLVSLLAVYATWQKTRKLDVDERALTFVRKHSSKLSLWGEAAIPQFLAVFWFLEMFSADLTSDQLLSVMIEVISEGNSDTKTTALADPYHELAEVIMQLTGVNQSKHPENYRGRSYCIESLIQLYVRRGWRQQLSRLWSEISKIHFAEFSPRSSWEYCLWFAEQGKLDIVSPKATQSWSELQEKSRSINLNLIPKIFQDHPLIFMLFLVVYPHRLTKNATKFLDNELMKLRKAESP